MLLFKSAAEIAPCYDGRTLAGMGQVAGDGLSFISIKNSHRGCHLTTDPSNNENFISCTQGFQARNSYRDLHKPDLRKVRRLECATTASLTHLLKAHNPETTDKNTIRRKFFKVLESLITPKTSEEVPHTKLQLSETSCWPANICVLTALGQESDTETGKDLVRSQDLTSPFSGVLIHKRSESQNRKPEKPSTIDHMRIPANSSNELTYSPLNQFCKDELFLGQSTSSRMDNPPVFQREKNEPHIIYENSFPFGNVSNFCLERKLSLTRLSQYSQCDRYIDDVELSQDEHDDNKPQTFTDIPNKYLTTDHHHFNSELSNNSLNKDLSPYKSYNTEVNLKYEKSMSFSAHNTVAKRTNEEMCKTFSATNFDFIDFHPTEIQSETSEYNRKTDSLNIFERNQNSHQLTRNAFVQTENPMYTTNSSIITINKNKMHTNSRDNPDNTSLTNYYEDDISSEYSCWEDEELIMALSEQEYIASKCSKEKENDENLQNANTVVPLKYFKDFWQESSIPSSHYLLNDLSQNEKEHLTGYFHWEVLDDENILEEAVNIMQAINEFLDTNIDFTQTSSKEGVNITEVTDKSESDMLINFDPKEQFVLSSGLTTTKREASKDVSHDLVMPSNVDNDNDNKCFSTSINEITGLNGLSRENCQSKYKSRIEVDIGEEKHNTIFKHYFQTEQPHEITYQSLNDIRFQPSRSKNMIETDAKHCREYDDIKLLFSSPQMTLNLTNPLNNTTYKQNKP